MSVLSPPRHATPTRSAPRHVAPPSRSAITLRSVLLLSLAVVSVLWIHRRAGATAIFFGIYGSGAVSYLVAKLALAAAYRPARTPTPNLTVAAVVPAYNEDPAAIGACIRSLLDQTHPFAEIWVADDGSEHRGAYHVARDLLAGLPGCQVIRMRRNVGKRKAQALPFQHTRAEIIMTIDSDTVLHPRCVEEALKPFRSRKVQAVCCVARALNPHTNLLTRLVDLRYSNAFLYERAAYSVLDSMLCATGVATLYRARVIKDNLDDYLTQRFLGLEVAYGDDRRLTNYALARGRVVLQDTAIASTLAPTKFRHFIRQQIRWNKSFFRETLYAIRNLPKHRPVWWLAIAELSLWLGFSTAMLTTLLLRPLLTGQVVSLYYVGYLMMMAYARSARHAARGRFAFALAPLYGLMHILVLTPVRMYALATLRNGSWGTRKDGPEVRLDPAVS